VDQRDWRSQILTQRARVMTGDYSHNPQLGTLMALLQSYQTLARHALHEWLEQRDEKERHATTTKE
jgi:ABC-type uncharacterized transport system permease subunit